MASIASLLGNLIPSRLLARDERKNASIRKPDFSAEIYTRLGIRPVINAVGTVTVLGGTIMPPEVVAAMEEAGRYFVSMPELLEKSGELIARLLGVEAAVVTTGAAGAITLATAACVTGNDSEKVRQLPDIRGHRRWLCSRLGGSRRAPSHGDPPGRHRTLSRRATDRSLLVCGNVVGGTAAGDVSRARGLLAEALAMFESLGMPGYSCRASERLASLSS